jgi:hypothetical protein
MAFGGEPGDAYQGGAESRHFVALPYPYIRLLFATMQGLNFEILVTYRRLARLEKC